MLPAIAGLEQTAAGALELVFVFPRTEAILPQGCVDDVGMAGIHGYGRTTGVVVLAEHFLPGLAAVEGSVDAAFGVRTIGMAEDRREYPVRIGGIDRQVWNLLTIPQTELTPRASSVVRAVHTVADGQVGAVESFPAADIDYVGIGWSDGDRADGLARLIVEYGLPGATCIVGLPDAAVDCADVEDVGVRWDTRDRARPAAAVRTDHSPLEAGGQGGVCRCQKRRADAKEENKSADRSHRYLGVPPSEWLCRIGYRY